jgi:hypothetical protein
VGWPDPAAPQDGAFPSKSRVVRQGGNIGHCRGDMMEADGPGDRVGCGVSYQLGFNPMRITRVRFRPVQNPSSELLRVVCWWASEQRS